MLILASLCQDEYGSSSSRCAESDEHPGIWALPDKRALYSKVLPGILYADNSARKQERKISVKP
ncbi:hypothetical protein STEG23_019599, partial [Scotinomys teguina]